MAGTKTFCRACNAENQKSGDKCTRCRKMVPLDRTKKSHTAEAGPAYYNTLAADKTKEEIAAKAAKKAEKDKENAKAEESSKGGKNGESSKGKKS